ncbi:hypothetical protein N7466_011643 [Penicillium verhagenii]|uniref:uncharacterized protein n=1 Tax=Penicillium verhagenii TaxID=1562060 RepID=UPI0025459F46|nr:uncharacterized protein N7466_011643 [Penicillium verhagenii]KAJ5915710.1 hypothetical protein N7466_011643 [Penicillium verhagenii]
MYNLFLSFVLAFCLATRWAVAASTPSQIADSLNDLAQQGYAAKALVVKMNTTADAGPISDFYNEIDGMVTAVLSDVKDVVNTPIISDSGEEQTVYNGYSSFVQSLLELMDALSSSASQLKSIDSATKDRVPSEVRYLQSAVDAYFYNVIGLFPETSAYNTQASNQKSQVDTHCFQAVSAFDLNYNNGNQGASQGRNQGPFHSGRFRKHRSSPF